MRVMRFAAAEANCVALDDERYFLFCADDGTYYMLPTTCPHRGGPLYLGRYVAERRAIECPWHKTHVSLTRLLRGALPMVMRGGQVTVVVATGSGRPPVVTGRKTLFQPPCAREVDQETPAL
jgi:nitrite reductase (NADH) small subunit